MNHLDPWEENLRRRLTAHQSAPPAKGWERLEASLGAKPRRKPFYLRPAFAASALSAAACLTFVVLLRPEAPVVRQTQADLAVATSQAALTGGAETSPLAGPAGRTPAARTLAGNRGGEASPPAAARQVAQAERYPGATGAVRAEAGALALSGGGTSSAPTDTLPVAPFRSKARPLSPSHARASAAQPADTSVSVSPSAPQRLASASPVSSSSPVQGRSARAFRAPRLASKGHAPLLAMQVSTAPSFRQNESGYYAAKGTYAVGGTHFAGDGKETADMALLLGQNFNRDVNTRVSHRTPFRVGLNVSVPLTARWSLATGLTYTRLATDIESGSDAAYYRTEQRLHYVGVPLQANYTVFASRPFNAYVTAGAQLEKCVKGEQNTTYYVDEAYKSSTDATHRLGNGLWQLSFQASAGLQFNLTRRVGLYFEPGVTYYVPDGSSLPSIRHDKPWQFNMQGGLRVTLGK